MKLQQFLELHNIENLQELYTAKEFLFESKCPANIKNEILTILAENDFIEPQQKQLGEDEESAHRPRRVPMRTPTRRKS